MSEKSEETFDSKFRNSDSIKGGESKIMFSKFPNIEDFPSL